jgi:hypothetical protein
MAELTRDESEASIFNLWHETLLLSAVDRHLLPLLDGSRDRDALLEALLAIDRQNPIPIECVPEERRNALAALVDELPQRLAEMKLIRLG